MTAPQPPAPSHHQNRVDPWGALHAVPDRGDLMGNRGILHVGQHVVRPWAHKAWVSCVLNAPFQKRKPFSPSTYSELFFLDEATALAAGHRPCRTCQRDRHDLFNTLWTQANPAQTGAGQGTGAERGRVPISTIDNALHAERIGPGKTKRTTDSTIASLPPGSLFAHAGQAWLVWPTGLRPWSFGGYQAAQALPADTTVQVLTPASIVRTLRAGFVPCVHPSATQPD
jgi:hypothetical protein